MGRVPQYHRDSFGSVRAVQRFANDIAARGRNNLTGIAGAALNNMAAVLDDKAERSGNVAEKAAFEQSSMNVSSGLASLAAKHKFDIEGFEKAAEEERGKYLGEIPQERSIDYALMYDKYKSHFKEAITSNQLQQQENQIKASFLDANNKYFEQATRFSRIGDDEALADNSRSFMENRKALFDNGMISPEAFVRMGEEFADNVELQHNLGQFDRIMPQGEAAVAQYLDGFMAREDMAIDRRDRFAAAMVGEYQSYKARNAVKLAETRKTSDWAVQALNNGITPQADVIALEQELRSGGDINAADRLRTALNLSEDVKAFVKLTPLQMQQVAQKTKEDIKSPYDLAKYETYVKTYSSAIEELKTDALGFARSRQLVSAAREDAFTQEDVQQRLADGRFLREKYNLSYTPVITKAEGEALSMRIATGDYNEKAAILGQLYTGFGEEAAQIFEAVAPKNPEFVQAASIYKYRPDVAAGIVEGVSILKEQKEFTLGEAAEFDTEYYNLVGFDTFSALKPEEQARIKQSVWAYTAKLARDNNTIDKDSKKKLVDAAVNDVIGDIAVIRRDGWFSGSMVTVPPQNVSADKFEQWFLNLDDEALKGGVWPNGLKLSEISLKESGSLLWAGDGKYQVEVGGQPILSDDGSPFVLEYKEKR